QRSASTGDPLVVHAVLECGTVVELGRDPWDTLSVVLGVDDADPLQQLRIVGGSLGPCGGACLPGVVGGTLDVDELAQSLHRVGGVVVGDELEATHQRVSPAKYLAAFWRISRSVVSFVVSALNWAFSASWRATRCSRGSLGSAVLGVGADRNGLSVSVPSAAVFFPLPWVSSHCRSVPRTIPRSSAIPRSVAPGVDSYRSTACWRNSSE